jgi:zinc/manganese transport system ATP-binding protein
MNTSGTTTGTTAGTTTAAPAVELCSLSASVAGRTLYQDVDARIERGQFAAILGPNGAGKSTLVRILLGQQAAAAGTVRVLGEAPGTANLRIGYLPQRRGFDPSLRIRGSDLVRLGLDGHRWGVPLPRGRNARAATARVAETLDLVGAAHYANRPISECSGGEQQRLLIAQALVREPELLLLDEPLDSLDLPHQAGIAALLDRVRRERQVAVVMVAHDINPILPYLDYALYLAPGGSLGGPPREVITTESLSALFHTTVEVLTAADGRLLVLGQPDAPAERHHHQHQNAEPEPVDVD